MRHYLRAAFILILTLGLLGVFLRSANLGQVRQELAGARMSLIVLSFGTHVFVYAIRALRWQYLLQPVGKVRFSAALNATIIGFAAISLLPGRVGEVLRPYLLARREGLNATSTFATIILERLLDLVVVLLLFGSFLWLFDPGVATDRDATLFRAIKIGGLVAAAGALVALVLVFVLAGHPEALGRAAQGIERVLPLRLAHLLARLVQTFAEGLAVVRQPRWLAAALALSVPLWCAIALGVWLVTLAFHITLPYTGSFLLLALLVVGVSVPTPGGLGAFHEAYRIGATAFFGAPNDTAIGAAIVLHATSFVPVALVGLGLMAREGVSLRGLGRLTTERAGRTTVGAAPPDARKADVA